MIPKITKIPHWIGTDKPCIDLMTLGNHLNQLPIQRKTPVLHVGEYLALCAWQPPPYLNFGDAVKLYNLLT